MDRHQAMPDVPFCERRMGSIATQRAQHCQAHCVQAGHAQSCHLRRTQFHIVPARHASCTSHSCQPGMPAAPATLGRYSRLSGRGEVTAYSLASALDNGLVVEVEPGRLEEMVALALDGLPEELKNNPAGWSPVRVCSFEA
jgi:hypothetical protein